MPVDHFPPTLPTRFFEESTPEEINAHLMNTYREPLRIFYLGMKRRPPHDADDVIHGFFNKRLRVDRCDLIDRWLTDHARRHGRLCHWLMRSLKDYVREHDRPRVMDPRNGTALEPDAFLDDEPDLEQREIRQALMAAFVRQALVEGEAISRSRNRPNHWECFVAHHLRGEPFAVIAERYGITTGTAYGRSRTAAGYFADAFERVLERDGADHEEIDMELEHYLAAIERRRRA